MTMQISLQEQVIVRNITINECTITNNANRGINIRGGNALVDINQCTLTNNGFDPYGLGGNDGFGIMVREGAVATVNNCFVTNPATVTGGYNVHAMATDMGTSPNATITANENSFNPNGNTTSNLANNLGGTLNATCNWWGSAIAANVTPYINGVVVYEPFLTTGTDNSIPTAGFQPVPNSCNGCTGGVTNTNTMITYCTIQTAIDDPQTLNGHVITVAAGTYVEDIVVSKSLDIRGPNYNINPNTGMRVAEAILMPATNDPEAGVLVELQASNTKINGFLLDGDNPSLSGGNAVGSADVNTSEGIMNGSDPINGPYAQIDNIDLQNNIFNNFDYQAVYLEVALNSTSSWNYIRNNKFHNAWEGIQTYAMHTDISDNVFTLMDRAISIHGTNANSAGGFVPRIANNEATIRWENPNLGSRNVGIWVNYRRGTAPALSVDNNILHYPTAAPSGKTFIGFYGLTLTDDRSVTFSNNIIDGQDHCHRGLYLSNSPSANVSLTGGSFTGIKEHGVLAVNSDPNWGAGNARLDIDNIDITMSAGALAGIAASGPVVNAPNLVDLEVTNTTVNGGAAGVLVSGSLATANIHNNPSTITGATIGVDIDGGTATLYRNNITANGTGVRVINSGNLTSATENFITNNTTEGIRIAANAGTIGAINDNDLSGNTGYAINDLLVSPAVNATCNWYGSAASGFVAAEISGNVTYSPWLNIGTDDQPGTDGFQPVTGACSATPVVISSAVATDKTCAIPGSILVTFSGGTAPYNIAWTGGSAMGIMSPYNITPLTAGAYGITVTDVNGSTSTANATILYLPVTNTTGPTYYATIQDAIDAAAANDVLEVCAGTYVEDIVVSKSLDIRGPNYNINPNTGMRVAEAIIRPATNDPEAGVLIELQASNTSINGFLLDGDNPSLSGGYAVGLADVNTSEGIQNAPIYSGPFAQIDNVNLQNNIFNNFDYQAIYLEVAFNTNSSFNYIKNNRFYNMWEGVQTYAMHADVSDNTFEDVDRALSMHAVHAAASGGFTPQVANNDIAISWKTAYARNVGIWINYRDGNAPALQVKDNTIDCSDPSLAGKNFFGFYGMTLKDDRVVEFMNDTITGAGNCSRGFYMSNSPSVNVSLKDCTFNNIRDYGVYMVTNDATWGAGDARLTVDNLTATMSPGSIAGVAVSAPVGDSPYVGVLDISNSTINGSAAGVLVSGSLATANIHNNMMSIYGNVIGIDVNGGTATITNNHIYDNGIGVRFINGGTGNANTNRFYDAAPNGKDIQVATTAGVVNATPNNWFAGTAYGVENLSPVTVDASLSYWNHPSGPGPVGPGTGANVSTNVLYCPWLDDMPVAFGGSPSVTSPTVVIGITETSGLANNDGEICAGAMVTLNATTASAISYAWSSGQNTASITVSPAMTTTYTVTVTFAGCTEIESVTITVNPIPVVSGPSTVCVGSTIQLLPSSGGTWISNNPAVASIGQYGLVTGVTPGMATFTFTSAAGCSTTSSSVTVLAIPSATITTPPIVAEFMPGIMHPCLMQVLGPRMYGRSPMAHHFRPRYFRHPLYLRICTIHDHQCHGHRSQRMCSERKRDRTGDHCRPIQFCMGA